MHVNDPRSSGIGADWRNERSDLTNALEECKAMLTYQEKIRMEDKLHRRIEDYTERFEFQFYGKLQIQDKVHKWDFLDELRKEKDVLRSELRESKQARCIDLLNLAHLQLLAKKERHGQILGYYNKRCPNDPLFYGKLRSLQFKLDEKPDAVLPTDQELLERIEQDREEFRRSDCNSRSKEIFFKLLDLVKEDAIEGLKYLTPEGN